MADDFYDAPDDFVLPFQIESSGARGRLVRMGPAINSVLGKHDYPESVSQLLGEAMTLTAMLGAALKFDGKFILQTNSEGPVSFLVAQYYGPGNIRGYASYDEAAVKAAGGAGRGEPARPWSSRHDHRSGPGHGALSGRGAARRRQSFRSRGSLFPPVRAAPDLYQDRHRPAIYRRPRQRAGLLVLARRRADGAEADRRRRRLDAVDEDEEDDAWVRAHLLAATVEDHELLDPMLAPERLLYRLFHEERVRAFEAKPLSSDCHCSTDRVERMLASFTAQDIEDMAEDGRILVTCEFCNSKYEFSAVELQRKASTLQ